MKRLVRVLALAGALVLVGRTVKAQNKPSSFDLAAAQSILAVQDLDGWLLADSAGKNRIAKLLFAPVGATRNPWFVFVPARGEPTLLCHPADCEQFALLSMTRQEYAEHRELKTALKKMLKGARNVAMEYAPNSSVASLTLVDNATVSVVKAAGVTQIASSASLVQYTKSFWGAEGRIAHYVAMHHLQKIVEGALEQIRVAHKAGQAVTEMDVVANIKKNMAMRGIKGPEPIVAAGAHSAVPGYTPTAGSDRVIALGDVVIIDIAASQENVARPIFARLGWVVFVGEQVPPNVAKAFESVVNARNAGLSLLADRIETNRPVKGFEIDKKVREVLATAKSIGIPLHASGYSLDEDARGDGANLDDTDAHDTRILVTGSGFTLEPALYAKQAFGIRVATSVYLSRQKVEVTGPLQDRITELLGNSPAVPEVPSPDAAELE